MEFNFNDKTFLITGASSGIGKHFALSLSDIGATVILGARNKTALDMIALEVNVKSTKCLTYSLDVTDENSINNMVDDLLKKGIKLDGIVNNAGTSRYKPFEQTSLEDWDIVMNTNLRSQWMMVKSCLCLMKYGSSIVNISSILSTRTLRNVPYSTSKAGTSHLTRCLALELANKGIRVNAIAPGLIKTEMSAPILESDVGATLLKKVPLQRAADPSELDGSLFLLLSDYSKYITGSIINVDGGLSTNLI